jgi:hypothetical protein
VKAQTKRKDEAIDLSSLPVAVEFITDTGKSSLKTQGLPDREALEHATKELASAVEDVMSAKSREYRELSLRQALLFAFTIGSYGTQSDNTKSVATARCRDGKDKLTAKRNLIADRILRASPDKNVKQLQPEIAAEFKAVGWAAQK